MPQKKSRSLPGVRRLKGFIRSCSTFLEQDEVTELLIKASKAENASQVSEMLEYLRIRKQAYLTTDFLVRSSLRESLLNYSTSDLVSIEGNTVRKIGGKSTTTSKKREELPKEIAFEIWLSGNVDDNEEVALHNNLVELMKEFDISFESEGVPIRGSFYNIYKFLGKLISSSRLIANLKTHFGAMAANSQSDVVAKLYKLVENHDSAVIRVGQLIIVKVTKNGKSHICVTDVSPSLENMLNIDSGLIRRPKDLLEHIQNPKNVVQLGASKSKNDKSDPDLGLSIKDNASNE